MPKASPILDLEVEYIENGAKGTISFERGEEIEVLNLLRDSNGTVDFTTRDGGDIIECRRVPKRHLMFY